MTEKLKNQVDAKTVDVKDMFDVVKPSVKKSFWENGFDFATFVLIIISAFLSFLFLVSSLQYLLPLIFCWGFMFFLHQYMVKKTGETETCNDLDLKIVIDTDLPYYRQNKNGQSFVLVEYNDELVYVKGTLTDVSYSGANIDPKVHLSRKLIRRSFVCADETIETAFVFEMVGVIPTKEFVTGIMPLKSPESSSVTN